MWFFVRYGSGRSIGVTKVGHTFCWTKMLEHHQIVGGCVLELLKNSQGKRKIRCHENFQRNQHPGDAVSS